MSPGELRTARDSLGVSAEFVAARVGFHVNNVWKYENPRREADVPDRLAEVVRDMLNDFECAAERIAAEVENDQDGSIPRMVTEEDRHEHAPEIRGWGPNSYGLLIAEVQRRTVRPVEFQL